jgi:signal transduction histidine kinase
MLSALFQNMLSNAIKFRDPSSPLRIEITSERSGPHGCRIVVRDNGIGFDMKYVDTILKPFGRAHASDYPGIGIGLASCKRILAVHGAELHVESERGVGSVFSFDLAQR